MAKQERKGRLIIISGPSGVGKGTICKALLAKDDTLALSISATTRPMGPGEAHGREYYFFDRETFGKMKEEGAFLEWAEVHGNFYGTMKKEVKRILDSGKDCILEIDVQGGLQVLDLMPNLCLTIFVKPPSEAALLERIRSRAREDDKAIATRMKTAQWEMMQEYRYAHSVVNDDLDLAVQQILDIIHQQPSDFDLPKKEQEEQTCNNHPSTTC